MTPGRIKNLIYENVDGRPVDLEGVADAALIIHKEVIKEKHACVVLNRALRREIIKLRAKVQYRHAAYIDHLKLRDKILNAVEPQIPDSAYFEIAKNTSSGTLDNQWLCPHCNRKYDPYEHLPIAVVAGHKGYFTTITYRNGKWSSKIWGDKGMQPRYVRHNKRDNYLLLEASMRRWLKKRPTLESSETEA